MRDVMQFITPGLRLLPEKMNTREAQAMLYAIGMQESRFEYRKQIGGPARGFWQFERGGITGVISHGATKDLIKLVCESLVIPCTIADCYEAVAFNDPLATCFARLLLFTLPDPLPEMGEYQKGWEQYISAWRPGKPREETWKSYFNTAWVNV